jgi:hypothetical protein
MTESKLQYTIPEAQSRLYERVDFIIRVGEDEKPCFKSGQHVKRGTLHQIWVRLNTESNSDLTRRLKDMTTEVTQSLTTYPHLKEITMNKIIDFRNALVRISDTYINDGKPNISDKISGYILTLDMHIPHDIKSKFAIPKMKNPYTSPGIVPQNGDSEIGSTTSVPIDIISIGSQKNSQSTEKASSIPRESDRHASPGNSGIGYGMIDNLSAAISKLIVSSTSPPTVTDINASSVPPPIRNMPPKLSLFSQPPSPQNYPTVHVDKIESPNRDRPYTVTHPISISDDIPEEYENEVFE